MPSIEDLFDRMDSWRHFPNYQLERRADLFFSLYLPQVIQKKTGHKIKPRFVPEFPVRIGAIYPEKPTDKSFKIDYVTVTDNGERAFLVELKTDAASRRDSQDHYLLASKQAGMNNLLDGVLQIFRATNAKRKYACLLEELEEMSLIKLPQAFKNIAQQRSLRGINKASLDIKIISRIKQCDILYVQPSGEGEHIISFADFAAAIENLDDPFAQRFAISLREWAAVKAGERG